MSQIKIVSPKFPKIDVLAGAFADCLVSGQVTNNGEYVRQFEGALSTLFDSPVVALNSGHSALLATLMALDVAGGQVIMPSFTFPSTAHAVVQAGAVPKFVDIDPISLCVDPLEVARNIGERTKAILGVDVYGMCCDYRSLSDIAHEVRIPFIVDSAPAFGSRYGDTMTGCNADAQVFSFHATKQMPTMEGGCVVSNDLDLISKIARIRNFGLGDDGDCEFFGFNGKMMEICAIIGVQQLNGFMASVERRRIVAKSLQLALNNNIGVALHRSTHFQQPNWLYVPITIDPTAFGMSRDGVVTALKKFDINARIYYPAVHQMTCYGPFRASLPVTEEVAKTVIALPCHEDLTSQDVIHIADSLKSIQEGRGY